MDSAPIKNRLMGIPTKALEDNQEVIEYARRLEKQNIYLRALLRHTSQQIGSCSENKHLVRQCINDMDQRLEKLPNLFSYKHNS